MKNVHIFTKLLILTFHQHENLKPWTLTFCSDKTGPANSFEFYEKKKLVYWTKWYVTLVQFLKNASANLTLNVVTEILILNYSFKKIHINHGIKGIFKEYIAVLQIFYFIHRCICVCTNKRCCLNVRRCECKAGMEWTQISWKWLIIQYLE